MAELSPDAISAGWRTIPDNAVRWAWKYKYGNAWQVAVWHAGDCEFNMISSLFVMGSDERAADKYRRYYWRPVSLKTLEYDPTGWEK